MGCDIHAYVERKIDDRWCLLHHIRGWGGDSGYGGQRDYDFFSHLCGVRAQDPSDCPEPKGLPKDVSPGCGYESNLYGPDGHSHSYESVNDFVDKKLALMKIRSNELDGTTGSREYYEWKILSYEMLEHEDRDLYRVVFWFDN